MLYFLLSEKFFEFLDNIIRIIFEMDILVILFQFAILIRKREKPLYFVLGHFTVLNPVRSYVFTEILFLFFFYFIIEGKIFSNGRYLANIMKSVKILTFKMSLFRNGNRRL